MDAAQEEIASDNADAGIGQDYQPLDRLNAFSDGVFAIVITLLVLDLPVPPVTELVLPALAESWPEFLGYAISFAFVVGLVAPMVAVGAYVIITIGFILEPLTRLARKR